MSMVFEAPAAVREAQRDEFEAATSTILDLLAEHDLALREVLTALTKDGFGDDTISAAVTSLLADGHVLAATDWTLRRADRA